MRHWYLIHLIHSQHHRTTHRLYKLYCNTINYILLSITSTTISQLSQIGNINTLFISWVVCWTMSSLLYGLMSSLLYLWRSQRALCTGAVFKPDWIIGLALSSADISFTWTYTTPITNTYPYRAVAVSYYSDTLLSTNTTEYDAATLLNWAPAKSKYEYLARSSRVCILIANLSLFVNYTTVPHVPHYTYDDSLCLIINC